MQHGKVRRTWARGLLKKAIPFRSIAKNRAEKQPIHKTKNAAIFGGGIIGHC
jgi:hypothetical protein